MNYRTTPEAVALAKVYSQAESYTTWQWQDEYFAMQAHCIKGEQPGVAAIRILAAECDALEKERGAFLEALKRIANTIDCPSASPVGEYQYGLHCGVEDRDCCDRYEGADYGYSVGFECALEWATNEASAAIAAAKGAKE